MTEHPYPKPQTKFEKLVNILYDEFTELGFEDHFGKTILLCSDSNARVNLVKLAHDIVKVVT